MVAQTRIEYNRLELNQLIYQDLMKQGLGKTASMLLNEAKLPEPTCATPVPFKITPASILTPSSSHRNTGGTPCWVNKYILFLCFFSKCKFLSRDHSLHLPFRRECQLISYQHLWTSRTENKLLRSNSPIFHQGRNKRKGLRQK